MTCVASAIGSLELPADIMPGMVCAPKGCGRRRPGTRLRVASRLAPGASFSDVIDAQRIHALTGALAVNGLPVRLYPSGADRVPVCVNAE